MRRLHLVAGIGAVLIFLITGQLMLHHTPPLATLGDSARLMFRSRHLYILAAGLVNLMLGLYLERHIWGWRRLVQTAGSALLLASPVLLVVAFSVEPARGFQDEMRWTTAGLYLLFGGSMAHLASGIGAKKRLVR
jgi:hypothetical protein